MQAVDTGMFCIVAFKYVHLLFGTMRYFCGDNKRNGHGSRRD